MTSISSRVVSGATPAQLRRVVPHRILQAGLALRPGLVDAAIRDTQLFFVVGMGRSGTVFLSRLLQAAEGCSVWHESEGDRDALVDAYRSKDKARQFLQGKRRRLIAARILSSRCKHYGETNSYLRHHVGALKEMWQPRLLHLVRDGRAVVRSIMNRSSFLPEDETHTGQIEPLAGDPCAKGWNDFERFQMVCWYWASSNREILSHRLPIVRLEDITSSYEHFKDQVLDPLEIDLPVEVWAGESKIARNVSTSTRFPRWEEWTRDQRTQFDEICGDVMEGLRYT